MFEKTVKHTDSFVVELPIIFPCLFTRMILNQPLEIVHLEYAPNKKAEPLTLDYRLFIGTHVPDIVVIKYQDQYSSLSKSNRKDVLFELVEVSKAI